MREYALVLIVCAGVTYLLTPLAYLVAMTWGALAPVRDRDVHTVPIPRLGGMAMFGGLLAGLLVASRLPHLSATFTEYRDLQAVMSAGAVVCVLGVLDDRYGIDALTKLAGQTLAAGVLVLQGVQLLYIPDPFQRETTYSLGDWGVPLTVLLVVLTINAVNFVDGLDGLAAGVVAISAGSFLVYTYELAVVHKLDRLTPPTLVAAALFGVCVGFLPHNFSRARIFMGDSGSMLIGLVLAAATVGVTGQVDPSQLQALDLFPVFVPQLLPLAVLAVPLIDLLLAVIRRTRSGRSPFAPDKMHLHHRLLEIGHSQKRAVLIMYLWTAIIAFTALAVSFSHLPFLVLTVAAVVAVLAMLASGVPRLRDVRRP